MDLSIKKCACCGAPINNVVEQVFPTGSVAYYYVPMKKYCDSVCRKHSFYLRKKAAIDQSVATVHNC